MSLPARAFSAHAVSHRSAPAPGHPPDFAEAEPRLRAGR